MVGFFKKMKLKTSLEQQDMAVQCRQKSDYVQSVKLATSAFKCGLTSAGVSIGDIYNRGYPGVPQNLELAAKWYRTAAENYDDEEADNFFYQEYGLNEKRMRGHAQRRLGDMYKNGRGVKQDEQEAAKWYRLAEENGITSQ